MGKPVKAAERKWGPILEEATPGAERESRCASGQLEDSDGLPRPARPGGEQCSGKMHPALFIQPLFPPCPLPPLLFLPEPHRDCLQERQMFLDAAEYWGPGKGLAPLDLEESQRGRLYRK